MVEIEVFRCKVIVERAFRFFYALQYRIQGEMTGGQAVIDFVPMQWRCNLTKWIAAACRIWGDDRLSFRMLNIIDIQPPAAVLFHPFCCEQIRELFGQVLCDEAREDPCILIGKRTWINRDMDLDPLIP